MSTRIPRRSFLTRTIASTAGAASLALAPPRAHGANERIGLAFIGVGGMGTGHAGTCSQLRDEVDIIAVCDVDEAHQRRGREAAGRRVKAYTDFRKVLEHKDVDAVVIATPEHWHPIIARRAFEAGKDVYVEKPLGHNIREGRAVIDGARQHGRVVQVGLQQRSGAHWQSAVERIRAGELGRVSMVHAWNAWNVREMFGHFGKRPDGPVPRGVDYDLWLGPAPKRPFNSARFHGLWYFFWDYAGGMVSGWGVHLFDVVAWALGYGVESVSMTGAKLILDDDRETPDTAAAVFNCPGFIMHYTMRHANGWRPHGDMDHGIEFFGDQATLQINRAGFQMYRETDRATRKPYYSEEARTHDYREHLLDFFAAIRSRGKTRCDAEAGHQATVYPHLANISYRVGRTVNWVAQSETVLNDPVAGALLTREYRDPWRL